MAGGLRLVIDGLRSMPGLSGAVGGIVPVWWIGRSGNRNRLRSSLVPSIALLFSIAQDTGTPGARDVPPLRAMLP